jgi:hypothetical protein
MSSYLTPQQVLDIADGQFTDPDVARTMAAIAFHESSGGDTQAIGDGGSSIGLWQINRIHFGDLVEAGLIPNPPGGVALHAAHGGSEEENEKSKAQWKQYAVPALVDPKTNAEAAWTIGWGQLPSHGPVGMAESLEGSFDFTQWSSYNNDSWTNTPNETTQFMSNDNPNFQEFQNISPADIMLGLEGVTSTTDTPVSTYSSTDKIGVGEWALIRNRIGAKDPQFASLLKQKEDILTDSRTQILDPIEASKLNDRDLAKQGMRKDKDIPWIISPIGIGWGLDFGKAIKSGKGIKNALWEKMRGAIMWGMPEDMNPKSFSTPDEWPTESQGDSYG